jgi:hypothetical protein
MPCDLFPAALAALLPDYQRIAHDMGHQAFSFMVSQDYPG